MAVINKEAKSLLARLLAMENLNITHDANAPTASFEFTQRTLTLPILKEMNGFHYDAFIAHEISHALNTPALEYQKVGKATNDTIVNIVEDARIERLVQNKYPGTRKDFYHAYEDFAKPEKDMFGLKDRKLEEASTIDRINLFFKIGRFVKIPFKQEEEKYVKMVEDSITFGDVEKASKAIYEYMKETNQPMPPPQKQPGEGEGEGEEGDGSAGFTQRNFEKNRNKKLIDKDAKQKNVKYGQALSSADVDRDTIVNKKVFKNIKDNPKKSSKYQEFMALVRPTISNMVSTFNMKKSASDYKKTQVSKTGKLDMKEISQFMTSEDIFKRNEIVFDEKNHGFIFFIDWSGSMSNTILQTYKQLLVLMHFCRRIGIPFEVYGFTSGSSGIKNSKLPPNKIVASGITNNTVFLMIESSMRKKDFEQSCETIFSNINNIHNMGDTPLYNTAILSDIIVESFKKKYGREKNIVVLLSDGGSGDSIGDRSGQVIINNPQLSKNYEIKTYHDVFKYMKDHQSVSKMIGMFISDSVDSGVVQTIYPNRNTKGFDYKTHFNNKRWVSFKDGVAFDQFFVIDVAHFDINDREARHFDNLDKYAGNAKVVEGFNAKMKSISKNMIFMNIFINEIS
jgi:hypothetical protein